MATIADASPPPPYTPSARPVRPTPEVTILLLGSPGVGKSSFLSAIPYVRDGRLQSPAVTGTSVNVPISARPSPPNPWSFSVTLFNRPYRFVTHRSESTLFVDPLPRKVDFVIFCYAVDSRESLYNCQFYWRKQFADRYERELGLTVPLMLLGLKRDLRTAETRTVDGVERVAYVGGQEVNTAAGRGATRQPEELKTEHVCVMPEEGLRAAQVMRCDKYAECSAATGELMWEALEDITRTAALTTTEKGGLTEGQCVAM